MLLTFSVHRIEKKKHKANINQSRNQYTIEWVAIANDEHFQGAFVYVTNKAEIITLDQ